MKNNLLKAPTIILSLFILTGCSTWGFKTSTTSEKYAPTNYHDVDVLSAFPNRPYKKIGECTVKGGAFASGSDMFNKMRKSAAELGADAVVIVAQSSSQVYIPGSTTTTGTVNTYGNTAYYNGTTTSTPGFVGNMPDHMGIAIKYTRTQSEKKPSSSSEGKRPKK
ncbi:MAG: hypothetical protein V4507_08200 [Verrucomicrobiota bacterium]